MTVSEKKRWKNWADCLRQEMMTGLTAEVTKSVEAITAETATSKAESTLRSARVSGKLVNQERVPTTSW